MARKPLDPDAMSGDELMGHLINAGMELARENGMGLPLVNALREQYPEVELRTIGQAVTAIGQGAAAASIANAGDPTDPLNLDIMPALPTSLFSTGETGRVAAFASVSFQSSDPTNPDLPPTDRTWDVRTECGEGLTFAELIDCIEQHLIEISDTDQYPELNKATNYFINLYFLGKRF